MAKRRRSGVRSRRAGAPQPAQAPPADPKPAIRSSALFAGLRLIAVMSATIIALVVFGVLQQPLGFWPALIIGMMAGILARAALLWLERIWLRAAARRALAAKEKRAS